MKDGLKAAIAGVGGAGAGAATYSVIGGVGLAIGGTAVGITMGPFITIGAGLGLTAYGFYWLGKQVGIKKEKK
jgi:hypothetical protein